MSDDLLYLNGAVLPLGRGHVGVEDRGFQLGDGVYEVVQVANGRLVWLDEHLARLRLSLGQIMLDEALGSYELGDALPRLVADSGLDEGMVYVQVTRGPAPRDFGLPEEVAPTVLAYTRAIRPPDADDIARGVSVHPIKDFRWGRCDIKSTNLLAAVMGTAEAREAGADEVVWIGPGPLVREGGSSNIFAVIDGVLRTHPADRAVLDGVTRRKILEIAGGLGVTAAQAAMKLPEFEAADEAFLSSTTRGVMPVVQVGGRPVGSGRPGPVTLRLADGVRAEIASLVGLPRPHSLLA